MNEVADLLIDVLLYLTDPHPRQAVDLSYLIERKRPRLRSNQHAVFSSREIDPLLASLSLTRA
jgi:hypothetical protein